MPILPKINVYIFKNKLCSVTHLWDQHILMNILYFRVPLLFMITQSLTNEIYINVITRAAKIN